ncbi:MAG: NAD(P)(+) transhydrogenase (Re/Si-specific) subunit beta [Candidatus Nanopelagicales bacterium]
MNAPVWPQLVDLFAAICFIIALKGLSAPKSARRGNLIGALGATVATVALFFSGVELQRVAAIGVAVAIGGVVGIVAARGVKMTAMPQLVAMLNGVGGGAAALVAITEWLQHPAMTGFSLFATVATVLIGAVSFTGSAVTFAKLQELMTTRPVVIASGQLITIGVAVATVAAAVLMMLAPGALPLYLLALLAAALGVLFVLPVGGADVPIVISLLNAFTGLSVAASGFVLNNVLLLIAGTLVGASGTLLTRMMASAMGRPITNTLFGAFTASSAVAAVGGGADRPVRSCSPEDVAILLGYARKVIFVPGYGLAVAQAQHVLHELAEMLDEKGIEVMYAIHPVAGRMPGHMNVLLAEAGIPYEQLREMDEVNGEFSSADVALVVGANDVVNPAARSDKTAPIYGMPILDVDQAASVVFLKRSMRPGFAGIENELLYDPKTQLLFGDAKDSLSKVVGAVKAM